jgi:hypothetical protein
MGRIWAFSTFEFDVFDLCGRLPNKKKKKEIKKGKNSFSSYRFIQSKGEREKNTFVKIKTNNLEEIPQK